MLSRGEMSVCLSLSLGQAKGVYVWGGVGDFHLEPRLSISPAVRGNARSRQDKTQSREEAESADKTAQQNRSRGSPASRPGSPDTQRDFI